MIHLHCILSANLLLFSTQVLYYLCDDNSQSRPIFAGAVELKTTELVQIAYSSGALHDAHSLCIMF